MNKPARSQSPYSYIFSKNTEEFDNVEEWNENISIRARELEQGLDRSYIQLTQYFIQYIKEINTNSKLVDVGCGLGYLTNALSKVASEVMGFDPSSASIQYASQTFPDIEFHNWAILEAASQVPNEFEICTANMVLHNVPLLVSNLTAIRRLLKSKGFFFFTVPHPERWLQKQTILDEFTLKSGEHVFKILFQIHGGQPHPAPITYIHRPKSQYIQALSQVGFSSINIKKMPPRLSDILFLTAIWR